MQVMLDHGIPLEVVLSELVLPREFERTHRPLRVEGYAAQMVHHSPVSQYAQLTRSDHFGHLDVSATMASVVAADVANGSFARSG